MAHKALITSISDRKESKTEQGKYYLTVNLKVFTGNGTPEFGYTHLVEGNDNFALWAPLLSPGTKIGGIEFLRKPLVNGDSKVYELQDEDLLL